MISIHELEERFGYLVANNPDTKSPRPWRVAISLETRGHSEKSRRMTKKERAVAFPLLIYYLGRVARARPSRHSELRESG
jgi:hypothetical protein